MHSLSLLYEIFKFHVSFIRKKANTKHKSRGVLCWSVSVPAVMEDAGATVFYDDEDDCLNYECSNNNVEYDYDYADSEKETLYEMYQYCLTPSLFDTGYYLLPLLSSTMLFRLFVHTGKILFTMYIYDVNMNCTIVTLLLNHFFDKSQIIFLFSYISEYISHKVFHILSVIIGLYIIQHYVQESLIILIVFVLFSYGILHVPKRWHRGTGIFLPSLLIIAYWYVLSHMINLWLYFSTFQGIFPFSVNLRWSPWYGIGYEVWLWPWWWKQLALPLTRVIRTGCRMFTVSWVICSAW